MRCGLFLLLGSCAGEPPPPDLGRTGSTDADDGAGFLDPDEADADGDGVSTSAGDCDDADPGVFPGAIERCDAIDDDCDGLVDLADPDLVDPIPCGACPDPIVEAAAPTVLLSYNPCLLDEATIGYCDRDDPDVVHTHDKGDRLHRIGYRTDQPLREELLLFLPPGPGNHNDRLLQWMAHAGYRVISLGWVNETSAFVPDDDFFEDLRTEWAYGVDASLHVDISPADSLVGRLTTLLDHLIATDPNGGWGAYRDATQAGAAGIGWGKIVISGWSEGGSQAAWLARDHLMAGVLLIAAPNDVGADDGTGYKLPPAPWVYDEPATPVCRDLVFYHQLEMLPNPAEDVHFLSWDAMGILPFGEFGVLVEESAPPYDGSAVLNTRLKDFQASFCNAHKAMAMDACMHDDLAIPYNWLFCTAGRRTPECP